MPRILAIDWDRHEARSVLVSSGPTGTSISGAWVASLTTADPAGLSGKQIGARLAAAMSGAVSGKVTTLVGVGRDNVQMKLMTLPPAPLDELPEMVRFQAEREFTALGSEAACRAAGYAIPMHAKRAGFGIAAVLIQSATRPA